MNLDRVLMVTRRSAYETYAEDRRSDRFSALARAGDEKVRALRRSHEEHYLTLDAVGKGLDRLGAKVDRRERGQPFEEKSYDLVVAVGGDGTIISAGHHIREVPLLGVNSAPRDSVGFFCGATRRNVARILDRIVRDRSPCASLHRLQVEIEGVVVPEPALNDVLYSHENPAAMARYSLKTPGGREEQKSSGVWIAAPAGSEAAVGSAGGRRLPLQARKFQFLVREPYQQHHRRYRFCKGILGPEDSVEIESHIGHGKIFVDGPHVCHGVSFGMRVQIKLSPYTLRVFGLPVPQRSRRKKRG